jgi:hypothetical protein
METHVPPNSSNGKQRPPTFEIDRYLNDVHWFESVTGLPEPDWMARRGELIQLAAPVDGDPSLGPHLLVKHVSGLPVWDAGAFRVWSLRELDSAVRAKWGEGGDDKVAECEFEIHVRHSADCSQVETSMLQARSGVCGDPGTTMFQVASNFNCCENASHRRQVTKGGDGWKGN